MVQTIDRPDSLSVAKSEAPPLNRVSINGFEATFITAWFALVAGLIEAGWHATMKFGFGNLIFSSSEFYWASPAIQVTVSVIFCSPLIFLAWRTRACTEYLVAVIFCFLAVYNTALLFPNLHYIAECIFALGAATQLARFIEKNPGRFLKFVKSTILYLGVSVIVLWAIVTISPQLQEQSAVAALPPAKKDAPNFLFIVLDTVTARSVELDSEDSNTPRMQQLAKEGVAFRNAYSTAPWTLPSHAAMMTSRYPHELSSGWYEPLDDEFPTIGEWMQEQGYRTAGFVGNTIYASADSGIGRGFMHFKDYVFSTGRLLLSTAWGRKLLKETQFTFHLGFLDGVARHRATQVCDSLVEWVENDKTHPYFAFANFFDAHDPYLAPHQFQTFVPTTIEEKHQIRYWWKYDKTKVSEQQVENEFTAYEDCMRYIDHEIGTMLDNLQRLGRLENTIVVITADHGEHFGDHELYGHGNSLYQASIHVPLIIWSSQDRRDAIEVTQSVSNRDVAATFAHYVSPAGNHPFHGDPLQRFFDADDNNDMATTVFAEISGPSRWPVCGGRSPVFRGAMKSVVLGNMKFILNGDGVEEFFDISIDPGEKNDLVETIEPEMAKELRDALKETASEGS